MISQVTLVNNDKHLPVVLVFNLIRLLSNNITGLYEHVLNRDSIRTYSMVKRLFDIVFSLLIIIFGPRPHMLSHTEEYSQLIDKFMVRHFLKPGITGWAQTNCLRGETKTTIHILQRVEADVW